MEVFEFLFVWKGVFEKSFVVMNSVVCYVSLVV